jgi:hypothetical protein
MMGLKQFREEFSGNLVCSLDFSRHRTGNVLHRNFMQALKIHAQRAKPANTNAKDRTMESSLPLRREKRFSLKDLDEDLLRRRDNEFFLELKEIRKRPVKSVPRKPKERPEKRQRPNEIACHCDVTIWDNRNKTDLREIARRSTHCTLTTVIDDEASRELHIRMEPFRFKTSDLRVAVKGDRGVKMEIIKSYFLQISIFPLDTTGGSWPPIPMNCSPDPTVPSVIQLLSKWVSLPKLPNEDNLLPVEILIKPINGISTRPPSHTKYGLQVNAGWIRAQSPLEEYNRSRNRKVSTPFLLTPDSESDQSSTQNNMNGSQGEVDKVSISYVFSASKIWRMNNMHCPFCKRDLREWNLLRVHLVRWHENFVFHIENLDIEGVDVAKNIKVDIGSVPPDQGASYVNDTFLWNAPSTYLDMQADPDGQDWKLQSTSSKPSASLTKRAGAIKQALPLSRTSSTPKTTQLNRQPSDAIIPAKTVSKQAKHTPNEYPVPRAPLGATFYRSLSKRPLREGEMLNESDDEVEADWISHNHGENIDQLANLKVSEKDFTKEFDAFLLAENLPSSAYLPESISRFVKKNRTLLERPKLSAEFPKLLFKLKMDEIVDKNFVKACLSSLHGSNQPGQSNTTDPMDVDEPKRSEMSNGGDDNCQMCKQTITSRRDGLSCANPVSTIFGLLSIFHPNIVISRVLL